MSKVQEASPELLAEEEEVERKKTKRGYATRSLPVVHMDDARYWAVSDAARILGPPELSESQVRQLIHLIDLQPKGKRPGGSRRRHVRVYDAATLARAYAAIASVMPVGREEDQVCLSLPAAKLDSSMS